MNTEMLVRPGVPSDLDAINEIYNDAVLHTTATFQIAPVTMEERRAWLKDHPENLYPVLVAETHGEVAGWGSLSRYASRCAYEHTAEDSIYVTRQYRRLGIGSLLLARLIDAARPAGHHTLIALIADNNPGSIRLHEKFGFQTVGQLRQVGHKFGRWVDITIMQKMVERGC
ncbi:MAG TPA: GNAT family N-acetyltransferase [Planctomycetota bacterium]|nr:GNAT family N-acetyltransferase [Planctomycetota bacterium]